MKDLIYEYYNIDDFYRDAYNPTPFGDAKRSKSFLDEDDPYFRGLAKDEILKNKYGYTKGLSELKELDLNISLGGSSRKYKYDEFDGDDLNYDRLLEGFPAMRKRVKTFGAGSGRLINIYVVISENCGTSYKEMVNKAHTAIRIIDLLERMGYRTAVWSCDSTDDSSGSYNGENGVHYECKICLKRFEDSLNKALILNGISPWFFRYFMFAHQSGHYMAGWGLGRAAELKVEQTKENIIINKGECLSKESSNRKIKEIEKLFGIEIEQIRYAIKSSYTTQLSIVVYKDRCESYDTKFYFKGCGKYSLCIRILLSYFLFYY